LQLVALARLRQVRFVAFAHSPVDLDRALARATGRWADWRDRLRSAPDEETEDDPLAQFRAVTGQELFRELRDLPAHDPLREPLQRWVYRLAEQRINAEPLTRLERERRRIRQVPEAPGRGGVSLARMLEGALQDEPRRPLWLRMFLEHAAPVSAISIELWQRRREIARRMGLTGCGEIESSLRSQPTPGATAESAEARQAAGAAPSSLLTLPEALKSSSAASSSADANALARRISEQLRDRVQEVAAKTPADLIGSALGQDIRADWPARLSLQRLSDYFRDGDLLRSLDLRNAPLPPSLGAASFCRALGVLGGNWFEALAPRDQPFVVAHDPYGLQRHEASALFAMLPLNARFLRRHLEVPRDSLADVQRRLGQVWLLTLAQSALRLRLRTAALSGEQAFREEFSDLVNAELGVSVPTAVAGALFRLDIEDEQRLLGSLLAVEREREMIEAHDEDWFRNPRAIEQLRAEAQRPPRLYVTLERAETALLEVKRRLGRLLR
jgi:hypothetical protein